MSTDKPAPREWLMCDICHLSFKERNHVIEHSAYAALEKECAELRAEVDEQCRLNGMGQERELKLMVELAAEKEWADHWKGQHNFVCLKGAELLKERDQARAEVEHYSSLINKLPKK